MANIKTFTVANLGNATEYDVAENITYTSNTGIKKTGVMPVTYELTKEEYDVHLANYEADPNYIFPESGKLFSETHFVVLDDYEELVNKAKGIGYTDTYNIGANNLQSALDKAIEKIDELELRIIALENM